jgi:hypothetical protein
MESRCLGTVALYPFYVRSAVRAQIREMLEDNIINPLTFVLRKGKIARTCLDAPHVIKWPLTDDNKTIVAEVSRVEVHYYCRPLIGILANRFARGIQKVHRVSLRMLGLSVYANAERFSQLFSRHRECSANCSWSRHTRLYSCICVRYSSALSDFRTPCRTFGYSTANAN